MPKLTITVMATDGGKAVLSNTIDADTVKSASEALTDMGAIWDRSTKEGVSTARLAMPNGGIIWDFWQD